MSALETINLILGFGMFTIALVKLVVELQKNNQSITFSRVNWLFFTI